MAVLNICSKEELDELEAEENNLDADDVELRRNVIRKKIKAVGKLARVFNVLRNDSESIAELKNLMGTTQLPTGYLALGTEGIKKGMCDFRRILTCHSHIHQFSDHQLWGC